MIRTSKSGMMTIYYAVKSHSNLVIGNATRTGLIFDHILINAFIQSASDKPREGLELFQLLCSYMTSLKGNRDLVVPSYYIQFLYSPPHIYITTLTGLLVVHTKLNMKRKRKVGDWISNFIFIFTLMFWNIK